MGRAIVESVGRAAVELVGRAGVESVGTAVVESVPEETAARGIRARAQDADRNSN